MAYEYLQDNVNLLGLLSREVALAVGELLYEGASTTGGSKTEIVDTDLGLKNLGGKNLVGNWATIFTPEADNQGESHRIVGWDAENTKLVVSPAAGENFATDSNYIVTPKRIGIYADAVNRAISESFPFIVFPGDFTLTVVEDTYTYTLPTDDVFGSNAVSPDYVARIWGDKNEDASPLDEIPDRLWRILPDGKLWLDTSIVSKYVGTDLIIEAYVRHTWITWGDLDSCFLPRGYVIPRAACHILRTRIGDKNAMDMANIYYTESAQILHSCFSGPPANSRKVRNMIWAEPV